MLFDLSNDLQKQQFKARCNFLYKKGCVVDLKEKKPKRTNSQNAYLHLILSYFGCETGNTLEYVKREYFKKLINPDTFIRQKDDPYLGQIKILRSSSELDTAEMTTAIERFRNWASNEAGIYLPAPEDERMLQLIEIEVERNKNYL